MPSPKQKILMCPPDHFRVEYVINPWMEGQQGKTQHRVAVQQWNELRDNLAAEADLVFVKPQYGLPDMVFTANAGMVIGKKVIISHFRRRERRGEEKHFQAWFTENGYQIADWPKGVSFEGAGDALLDRGKPIIWSAYGYRSDTSASAAVGAVYNKPIVSLCLIDPRFYHLDTCLCPLEGGFVMYYPPAFNEPSQKLVMDYVPVEKRIIVSEEDAAHFACNAVDLNGKIFLNNATSDLQNKLHKAGFQTILTPLSEFMKAGGAAKCLTLKLIET